MGLHILFQQNIQAHISAKYDSKILLAARKRIQIETAGFESSFAGVQQSEIECCTEPLVGILLSDPVWFVEAVALSGIEIDERRMLGSD